MSNQSMLILLVTGSVLLSACDPGIQPGNIQEPGQSPFNSANEVEPGGQNGSDSDPTKTETISTVGGKSEHVDVLDITHLELGDHKIVAN